MAPSYTDNNDYKKDIEDFYRNIEGKPNDGELINFTRSLRQKYDITTLNNSIKTSQKSLRREWIKTTIFRLVYSLSEPLLPAWAGSITIKNIFALDMNILYLFLIFYLVLFIHSTSKTRILDKQSILLWITVVGNLCTVIIGAQDAWGRLFLPSLPLFIIMFGQALNYIKFDINGFTKKTDIE